MALLVDGELNVGKHLVDDFHSVFEAYGESVVLCNAGEKVDVIGVDGGWVCVAVLVSFGGIVWGML
jgi:hypothetical protein